MVLNYFEVMINYIIALTLHARRNNLMSFCPYQRSQWWYYDHHEFLLDWLCLHSWTQNLCILQGESDMHWPRFSSCHAIPPQFSSVKADGQQTWVRQKEFVHVLHLIVLRSSSLLNYVASQKIYLLDVMWLFLLGILISNICNNPIMIQQLLLTSFFIDNTTKQNTII